MDERTIFLEALDQPDPAQRDAFLNDACAEDSTLRKRVEALLLAHADAGSFLEKTPEELDALVGPTALAGDNDALDDSWMELLTPSGNPERLGLLSGYEVIELVGRGGMGLVLRAHDPRLNRIVAIKLLAPELAANVMAVRRFLREAQAAAAVSHDHVVTIHAIDEESRPPVIVMEYIEGQSLQQKIDRTGSLDVKSILRIGMQTAAGLAAAHRQGLVHRDIKPANILLENGIERVKLTDFGLARAVDDIGMTRTGQITGTPQYMSPEQAQGQRVDHRTDLFSLGCVLYAMCTGRAAFRADSAVAVMHSIVHDRPKPVRHLNEDIPDWLCEIVAKLMSKNSEDRFDSADDVELLLSQHLRHLQQPDVVPAPAAVGKPTSVHPEPAQPDAPPAAAPWHPRFWMTPQPGFARMVGFPILGLLALFVIILVGAHTAGVGVAEATIVSILASGIFGIPLAFVALIFLWTRTQQRNPSSEQPGSNRGFWGVLFAIVPVGAAGIARGQLGLSGTEAAVVAAVLGGIGAVWIHFARKRMMTAESTAAPATIPDEQPDETVDLPPHLLRDLRSVHWNLTLSAMASFATPALLHTAADQRLFPFADVAFWLSLVAAAVTFPVVIGAALKLNWLDMTRRRPSRLVLIGTAVATIAWSPLLLILLPWTIRSYRRVRQSDVLEAMGLTTPSPQQTARDVTRIGLIRIGAAVLIMLTIAAVGFESIGWTHWTVRAADSLRGNGTLVLTNIPIGCIVEHVDERTVTVIGKDSHGRYRIPLKSGQYELAILTRDNRLSRTPLIIEAGTWQTTPISAETIWIFVRGPGDLPLNDAAIIVKGNASVSFDGGAVHSMMSGRTVIFAPREQYVAIIRSTSGSQLKLPCHAVKPGETVTVTPADNAVSVRIEPDTPEQLE